MNSLGKKGCIMNGEKLGGAAGIDWGGCDAYWMATDFDIFYASEILILKTIHFC